MRRKLLGALDVDRFAVVGHGVGGAVAQLLALDGGGVDAMVLARFRRVRRSPIGAADASRSKRATSSTDVEAAVRRLFETGIVDRRPAHGPRSSNAYLRPWRSPDGVARFAAAVRRSSTTVRSPAVSGDLARIEFPVLILWGEDDPFFPGAVAERLNEAMPSSTLGLLPGCGHFLAEEAPETIGPMIAEYLRARYLMEPHGHDQKDGVVMLQLERRPPWVDLAADEADDWFDVRTKEED